MFSDTNNHLVEETFAKFQNDQMSIHLCLCLFGVRQQNLNVCVYPYMPLGDLEFCDVSAIFRVRPGYAQFVLIRVLFVKKIASS